MRKTELILSAVAVSILSFAVFAKSLPYEFLNWDDEILVTLNPYIRGFSSYHIKGMFFNEYGLFIPLVYISFAIDHWIYGLDPWGFRLTNIIFHTINSILFFYIFTLFIDLRKHSKKHLLFSALIITAAWCIHPLRIESVVWIAERKDVLSGFFLLLSFIFYFQYRASKSDINYLTERFIKRNKTENV